MDQETRETLERMAEVIRDQQAEIAGLHAMQMLHRLVLERLMIFSNIMGDMDASMKMQVNSRIVSIRALAESYENPDEIDGLIESIREAIDQ